MPAMRRAALLNPMPIVRRILPAVVVLIELSPVVVLAALFMII